MLLAVLTVFVFGISPILGSAKLRSEIGLAFYALIAAASVSAVARRRSAVLAVGICAAASIALDWIAYSHAGSTLEILDVAFRAGFVGAIAITVTAQVFRPGEITHHRVQGAIVVYLLAGLAWGYLFEIIALAHPGAFRVADGSDPTFDSPGLFRYFSFATLTTLGYGDVLPLTPLARSVATLEAIIGQLYPTVMIARLITLELSERRAGRVP